MRPASSRVSVPLRPVLVGSHVAILALPLAVLLATGAWSHDLLHQRQEELAREAALVAMMVEGEWGHSSEDAVGPMRAASITPARSAMGPPDEGVRVDRGEGAGVQGGEHAVGLPVAEGARSEPDPTLAAVAPALTGRLVRVFQATHAGVRIVDANGKVLATSGPRLGESMADHAEFQAAMRGTSAVMARTELPPPLADPPMDERKTRPLTWASAAVPIAPEGRIVGVVVLTRPTRGLTDAARDMSWDLGEGIVVAVALTVGMALWLGWRLSRSLRGVAAVANELADERGWAEGRPGGLPVESALATLSQTRIREVRTVAHAFRRLVEQLSARLRYNQELAGNVAHEFKTPLATLRGTMDVLADDSNMPADQRARFLENARTDLDRLDRMVSGLLALARAETPAHRKPVALDEVLEDAAARYPDVTCSGRAGTVTGDSAQLETAVVNLLENAHSHGAPPFHLRARQDGASTLVEVEDAGPGISAANLPHIFERFFTTSAGRTGTGLGLPLVRAIARAHGGEVEVESRPGRTVFRLRLPAAPA